jgi:hypothetical protein
MLGTILTIHPCGKADFTHLEWRQGGGGTISPSGAV